MKGQLKVKTPAEYIAAVDDKRRPDVAALDALVRKQRRSSSRSSWAACSATGRSTTATRAAARATPAALDRQQRLLHLAVLLRR